MHDIPAPATATTGLDDTAFWADPLHRMLRQMLVMQDALNTRIHPQWRLQGYAWHRAIYVEGAELLEHLGVWKWWKKGTPDLGQARLELVDIWHFGLSWLLVRFGQPADSRTLTEAVARRVRLARGDLPATAGHPPELAGASIDDLVMSAGDGRFALEPFFAIAQVLGISFAELFQLYIAKNALNEVRQRLGYQSGAYQKVWAGREDNEHLIELLAQAPEACRTGEDPDLFGHLCRALEDRYRELTA